MEYGNGSAIAALTRVALPVLPDHIDDVLFGWRAEDSGVPDDAGSRGVLLSIVSDCRDLVDVLGRALSDRCGLCRCVRNAVTASDYGRRADSIGVPAAGRRLSVYWQLLHTTDD